ncbi:unnamed protein product [Polarella glacialis]|uniref:ABC transporter domain-containing protein n=1 Tax=Polarella glacialis TaxID=89957 RepID=A0A813ESD5_POLGL|nr:unnamed protein product [Polarella glacialis]
MWTKPHVIAFDEPTNYLDFATVNTLAKAIKLFRGGTIVVTHNEDFLKQTCEEIWRVEDGRVTIEDVHGTKKNVTNKAQAASMKAKSDQMKKQMQADLGREERAKSGPTEAELALQVYLKARAALGAPKADIKLQNVDLEIAYYKFDKFPKNLKVLIVEQEVMGDARHPIQWVLDSDVERRLLLAQQKELQEEKDLPDVVKLKEVSDRLEEIGAHEAEPRAARILRGLQFTDDLLQTPTSSLSGGWRMRVSLASALFAQPELLLLDEPTNHLDFPAVMYLEEYLQSFKNICVIVSHDRGFLNSVCTDIVLLNGRKLAYYKGDYDTFQATVKMTRLAQQSAYDSQQKEISHIMEFINHHDERPKIVAQKASKQKMLDKMEKIEDPSITFNDSGSLSITFPNPGALPKNELISWVLRPASKNCRCRCCCCWWWWWCWLCCYCWFRMCCCLYLANCLYICVKRYSNILGHGLPCYSC